MSLDLSRRGIFIHTSTFQLASSFSKKLAQNYTLTSTYQTMLLSVESGTATDLRENLPLPFSQLPCLYD